MHDNRREALEDIKFVNGDQWPEEAKNQRGKDTVELVINRTQATVKQVVNQQRQNRPAIRVRPVDSGSDKATAEVIEGLVRNIEQQSNAEAVYDWGFEAAVNGGYGYWRVVTEYCDPDSFDQEIRIKRIRNRFDVTFDPKAEETLKEDARWAFVHKNRDKTELQKKHKKATFAGIDGSASGEFSGWWDEETARVAEYFYKVKRDKLLVAFSDGSVISVPERIEGEKIDPAEYIDLYTQQNGVTRLRERVSHYDQVKWCLATATEILEERDWAGKYIPIVPVIGDEIDVEGKLHYAGLVRYMRDPARMYNYWLTKATRKVALSPEAKILVTAKQMEGYEKFWDSANTDPRMYLPYNSINGESDPKDIRPAQLDSGFASMIALSSDQLKEVSGIYDASLGARGNETSGIAINQRKQQGDNANYHFLDNMNRSIAHTGRIVVDLIPTYYDTEKTARILGEDGSTKMVTLNKPYVDEETNQEVLYDMKAGKYDVVTEAGPGFATKRQEAFDYMVQMFGNNPEMLSMFGDLLFQNADLPNADKIAERFAQMQGQGGDANPNQGIPGIPPGMAPGIPQ